MATGLRIGRGTMVAHPRTAVASIVAAAVAWGLPGGGMIEVVAAAAAGVMGTVAGAGAGAVAMRIVARIVTTGATMPTQTLNIPIALRTLIAVAALGAVMQGFAMLPAMALNAETWPVRPLPPTRIPGAGAAALFTAVQTTGIVLLTAATAVADMQTAAVVDIRTVTGLSMKEAGESGTLTATRRRALTTAAGVRRRARVFIKRLIKRLLSAPPSACPPLLPRARLSSCCVAEVHVGVHWWHVPSGAAAILKHGCGTHASCCPARLFGMLFVCSPCSPWR